MRQRTLQDSHDLRMLRRHAVPLRQARERHRGGLEAQVGETEGVWGQAGPCGDQHALECHLQGAGSWPLGVTIHWKHAMPHCNATRDAPHDDFPENRRVNAAAGAAMLRSLRGAAAPAMLSHARGPRSAPHAGSAPTPRAGAPSLPSVMQCQLSEMTCDKSLVRVCLVMAAPICSVGAHHNIGCFRKSDRLAVQIITCERAGPSTVGRKEYIRMSVRSKMWSGKM